LRGSLKKEIRVLIQSRKTHGGFVQGNKSVGPFILNDCLESGISVAPACATTCGIPKRADEAASSGPATTTFGGSTHRVIV